MDLEILEALALSDDRGAALAQLLPGSEDHDYYRAIHAQHRGALDEVDAILARWPDRHGRTPRHDQLVFRQQLYRATATAEQPPATEQASPAIEQAPTAPTEPATAEHPPTEPATAEHPPTEPATAEHPPTEPTTAEHPPTEQTPAVAEQTLTGLAPVATAQAPSAATAAIDQLRDRFGVGHWHEAEVEAVDPTRPTRVTDGAFDPIMLLQQAAEYDANLAHITDEGASELLRWKLEAGRRRVLLNRLGHTPEPRLVELVADDLDYRGSTGFGSIAAHHQLTLAQLHALAVRRPELRSHTGWIHAVVTRMQPLADLDLELDREARAAHLDALWQFVGALPPAANSLKAHVLWHLLDTTRRRGLAVDRDLFRDYLALPRQAPYVSRARLERIRDVRSRDEVVQLGADFAKLTRLAAAGSDEELIRDLLRQQLADAESYAAWLDRDWLDAEIATAQLLAGEAVSDRATLVLGPSRAAALRDRIELAWCAHNPARFAAGEPIALDVDVKNVGELVIKVFRIDPLAYFQHHHREVDTRLDLDGLAASDEQVLRFTEPAIRRVRRRIELAACTRPGTYVIDLIGNGMSSRAVVHKGRLRYVMRIGAAGHVITMFDEAARPRPDARAWIGDREHVADEHGAVIVPFSTQPGRTPMLLAAGDIASVEHVELVAETTDLTLALSLDRQGLTAGRAARAIARLGLSVGGAPASLALIQQATWDLTLIDRHGVATTRSQPLALDDEAAAVLEWPLGDDPATIELVVRGRIEIRSEQRDREIRVARRTNLAEMYAGPSTEALYLAQTAGGWVVSALGKTGEPRAHRPVTVGLVHRWCWNQLQCELATDAAGRVELGALPGARRITATLGSLTQTWDLDDAVPAAVPLYVALGQDAIVHLPASRTAEDALAHASLVEIRGGSPARHVQPGGDGDSGAEPAAGVAIDALAGALVIRGLPAGEFQLRAHGLPVTTIYVTAPLAELAGWAIAPAEVVELPRFAAAIAAIDAADDALVIRLRGGDAATRVHVIATRFVASPIDAVAEGPAVVPRWRADRDPGARYVSGRELGDEYRYVLERRAQPRFPGLLLDRPSLLLNPWSRRTTTTDIAPPRPSQAFGAPAAATMIAQRAGGSFGGAAPASDESFTGYDFLAAPPAVLANLVPGADGVVRVALAALAGATSVTVIADDPAGRSRRRVALPEPALAPRDLRLTLALDPARHATQRKAIAPLTTGATLVIEDLATAKLHLIDTVERAHAYLLALRDDPTLREFAFVTRWHALPDAERRALYSKYACHELHLFLYFKDRGFFDAVIRPYLAHKRTKTFLDHWLLDAGAEVAAYAEPARLATLNAVERALLAWRLTADDALPRLLADEVATQPPAPGLDARLIDALLGAQALDGDDRFVARDIAESADAEITGSNAALAMASDDSFDSVLPLGGPPRGGGAAMARSAPPPMAQAQPQAAPMANRARQVAGMMPPPPAHAPAQLKQDVAKRAQAKPMYRAADTAQEWAEHNWWRRTPADSGAGMIAVNRLWRDLAAHPARDGQLLSPWLGLATTSFAEAMAALAVIDLPFVAPGHAITSDGPRLTIVAAGSALAGTSQLVDGELVTGGPPLVVGMSYVRADDRHDWRGGEQVDKYVEGALAVGVVYTCQVVLANPTSSRQRVSALVQIPRGSLAVAGARPTHTIDAVLAPYGTLGHEYSFYFPAPGRWTQFPVHVTRGGQIVAAAPARALDVQAGDAAPDPRSWPFLSQRGALGDVVAYLATANLAAIDLTRVAWRLRDPGAYHAILAALEARRAFDATLWGYALLHRDPPRIRAWLRARGAALLAAGPVLDMLGLDAERLGGYEHLELAPLVNARAHRLGGKLRILNDGLAAQYTRFLELVAHRRAPGAEDLLAATHYLLAQGRIPEALAALARVDAGAIADRLQYDYLTGYAACLTGELARARAVTVSWRDHPVDRWRHRIAALAAMLDELDGAAPGVVDPRSRDQQQAELAAAQPAFDLAADRDGLVLHSRNVTALELRFFEMDIELLFSRQPFVQSDVSRFSFIEPGHREPIVSPPAELRVAWPDRLRGKNVVVEAVGAGMRKAKVHYANDLVTTLSHQYGQIRVQRASDHGALAATYVKVYARRRGGEVAFYKDGYTDLRGWFDYATLSTTELDAVERFAILVCSDRAGAAILEATPPAR
jgi:hypothetical protein